ncbi:MAG: hypothetical protein PHI63_04215 [Patescibacteria group bacterium]|nr:hypothetical protein [Patescibacteria group bacterium]
MTPERWEQVKGMVKDKFQVISERQEPAADGGPGTVEILEFVTPAGKIRLEWVDAPLKLSTRALGSKRIGSSTTVIHEYSDTERVHRFDAYRWDEATSSWIELRGSSAEMFGA